jgi:hypothetical protein
MKKHNYKDLIFGLVTLLMALLLATGCKYAGLVSLMGTESYYEEKIPAEFDMSKQIDKKILVLVDQPAWLDSQINLRYYLTKTLRQNIMIKTKLTPENLISYDKLVEFRSTQPNFSSMSPVEIGKAMDANMVLLVLIENYNLNEVAQSGYLMGDLDTRAILYDTQTGERLWPKEEASKSIRVGFECETGGFDKAISRLAIDSAFCTTRYFYDCPKAQFRIADDKTRIDWEGWK